MPNIFEPNASFETLTRIFEPVAALLRRSLLSTGPCSTVKTSTLFIQSGTKTRRSFIDPLIISLHLLKTQTPLRIPVPITLRQQLPASALCAACGMFLPVFSGRFLRRFFEWSIPRIHYLGCTDRTGFLAPICHIRTYGWAVSCLFLLVNGRSLSPYINGSLALTAPKLPSIALPYHLERKNGKRNIACKSYSALVIPVTDCQYVNLSSMPLTAAKQRKQGTAPRPSKPAASHRCQAPGKHRNRIK